MDIDEMIAECEKKRTYNEVIAFALGAGRIYPVGMSRKMRRAMKEAVEYISKLDGFIGFHPVDIWHTMLIFDTMNNAKGARNLLKAKDVAIGQIVPILVEKRYVEVQNADSN